MPHARHATRADSTRLGRALCEAFRTDPVWQWIAPDPAPFAAGLARYGEALGKGGAVRGVG